jgi:hypothetical protein
MADDEERLAPHADAATPGGVRIEHVFWRARRCWARVSNLHDPDRGSGRVVGRGEAAGVRDGYLRGSLLRTPTDRQVEVLAAFVAAGGSVADAAARVGVRPSTAKRHLADLRARSGLTTEQLIYRGRAEGVVEHVANGRALSQLREWVALLAAGSTQADANRRLPTPRAGAAPGCVHRLGTRVTRVLLAEDQSLIAGRVGLQCPAVR